MERGSVGSKSWSKEETSWKEVSLEKLHGTKERRWGVKHTDICRKDFQLEPSLEQEPADTVPGTISKEATVAGDDKMMGTAGRELQKANKSQDPQSLPGYLKDFHFYSG